MTKPRVHYPNLRTADGPPRFPSAASTPDGATEHCGSPRRAWQ
jgi:hypothetical protein